MNHFEPDLMMFAEDFPPGVVLRDIRDAHSGLRLLVARGPITFCGYVGVQASHVLAGLAELEFPCHQGVTFRQWGQSDSIWDEGWFWWGWDYGHAFDDIDWEQIAPDDAPAEVRQALARLNDSRIWGLLGRQRKRWTLGEVIEDCLDTLMQIRQALLSSQELATLLIKR